MRVIPHMMVITPCDWWETYKATLAVYDIKGPSYVRFGRNPAPVVTDKDTPFDLYKAAIFRDGRDVTLFANGLMVHEALTAAANWIAKHFGPRRQYPYGETAGSGYGLYLCGRNGGRRRL